MSEISHEAAIDKKTGDIDLLPIEKALRELPELLGEGE